MEWVKNAICLRDAGVSVEAIAEYVKLFKQGDKTIEARLSLLQETREQMKRLCWNCKSPVNLYFLRGVMLK